MPSFLILRAKEHWLAFVMLVTNGDTLISLKGKSVAGLDVAFRLPRRLV